MSSLNELKCTYGIASELVLNDNTMNALSLINICEDINALNFPFVLGKLSITHLLTRDSNESKIYNLNIEVKINNEQPLNYPVIIDAKQNTKIRLLSGLTNLLVSEPGIMKITLIDSNTNDILHELIIPITQMKN